MSEYLRRLRAKTLKHAPGREPTKLTKAPSVSSVSASPGYENQKGDCATVSSVLGDRLPATCIAHASAEHLRPELVAAAARGTDVLATLWCALSPLQKLGLKPQFDACWVAAELADARQSTERTTGNARNH